MTISLAEYIKRVPTALPPLARYVWPWQATGQAVALVGEWLRTLGDAYRIHNGVAVHRTATVEEGVVLKGPVVVAAGCFLGAHAYLRGGVFLDEGVTIGPGCEVKSSFLFQGAALAHFNFVGDSLVGAGVNLEAGAVLANHYNERTDKDITVRVAGQLIPTGVQKFGALIGDGSRLGANAVTSPGTILEPGSVVGRLELVEQVKLPSPPR
ncbi:MAG: LpxA family transferase [Cytophagales bacterium]|nr:LpxA family transferase [Cytophagales bacterium]